jgi:hypothetical protein
MNLESDILAHFKAGRTLTVMTCLQKFHTSELRQYVSRINGRKKVFIEGTWEKQLGKRYKRFWLAASTNSAR